MLLQVCLAVHYVIVLMDSDKVIIGTGIVSTIILPTLTLHHPAIKWGRCHHQHCLDYHVPKTVVI